MKKFMVSYYSWTGKHEVSIYQNLYSGSYLIYLDGEYWTDIDSLYQFESELSFIESSMHTKFGFFGF